MNAAGGKAGERWHCEVGVLTDEGESMGDERDTTYACLVSRFPVPASAASIAASSLCTATEKRRQKFGSWTMMTLSGFLESLKQVWFAVWVFVVVMFRFAEDRAGRTVGAKAVVVLFEPGAELEVK